MFNTRSLLALLTGLVASASGLVAGPFAGPPPNPCTAGSLTTYEDGTNTGCILGVLILNQFAFSSSGTGGATLLGTGGIEVTPTVSQNGLGGSLAFSSIPANGFSVGANQTADYEIDWHFVIDPGPEMDGADLGLDPPMNDIFVDQLYCLDSDFTILDVQGGGLVCSNGNTFTTPYDLHVTPGSPNDSTTFQPPAMTFGNVRTHISLNGDQGPASFDSVISTGNVVDSSAPEPSTIFLGLGGVAALLLTRRRRTS